MYTASPSWSLEGAFNSWSSNGLCAQILARVCVFFPSPSLPPCPAVTVCLLAVVLRFSYAFRVSAYVALTSLVEVLTAVVYDG